MSRRAILLAVFACVSAAVILPTARISLAAQSGLAFRESEDHPAIEYSKAPLTDPVSVLNRRIETGAATLTFDRDNGYLSSVLQALQVPKESQIAVFSATSLQADKINAQNPRTIYYNDNVAVGWVRGGLIEVAALDPRLGPIFYLLDQRPATAPARPQFKRSTDCLECHRSWETLAVPGLMVLSTFPPTTKNGYASGGVTDHRTPLSRRWASWYVTGRPGANRHMGNKMIPTQTDTSPSVAFDSLQGHIDLKGFPAPYSDVVALMVFEHQTHMTNLLTFIAWESRLAEFERRGKASSADRAAVSNKIDEIARELVDYLLFVDEAPLAGKIEGTSGFTQLFSAEGPRDSEGRSLRQFDLERRLMRYPCSYMIYSPLFDGLPAVAKDAIYKRMWAILSGADKQEPYGRLSPADRRAIVDILRATKKDLPSYFQPVRS